MGQQMPTSYYSDTKTALPGEVPPQGNRRRASLQVFPVNRKDLKDSSRRFSLALSDVSSHSDTSLTRCLPITIDPHEKERIDSAIHDIEEEEDPTEQARKSTLFLANLQVLYANRFNAHMKRTNQQTQDTLGQLEQGLVSLQQTEQRMHETVEQTHATQKRLRTMAYISFTIGIFGFGFVVYNGIKGLFSEND